MRISMRDLKSPIYAFRRDLKDFIAQTEDGHYVIKIDGQTIITTKKQIKMLYKRLGQMLEEV